MQDLNTLCVPITVDVSIETTLQINFKTSETGGKYNTCKQKLSQMDFVSFMYFLLMQDQKNIMLTHIINAKNVVETQCYGFDLKLREDF